MPKWTFKKSLRFWETINYRVGISLYCASVGLIAYTTFHEIPLLRGHYASSALPKFAQVWDRTEYKESYFPTFYQLSSVAFANLWSIEAIDRDRSLVSRRSLAYVVAMCCPLLAGSISRQARTKGEKRMVALALRLDNREIGQFIGEDAREELRTALKAVSESRGYEDSVLEPGTPDWLSFAEPRSEMGVSRSASVWDSMRHTQTSDSWVDEERYRHVVPEEEEEMQDLLSWYQRASNLKLRVMVVGGLAALVSAFL